MAVSAVKFFFAALSKKMIVLRRHFIRILDGLIATGTNITVQEPLGVPKSCTQENGAGTILAWSAKFVPRPARDSASKPWHANVQK